MKIKTVLMSMLLLGTLSGCDSLNFDIFNFDKSEKDSQNNDKDESDNESKQNEDKNSEKDEEEKDGLKPIFDLAKSYADNNSLCIISPQTGAASTCRYEYFANGVVLVTENTNDRKLVKTFKRQEVNGISHDMILAFEGNDDGDVCGYGYFKDVSFDINMRYDVLTSLQHLSFEKIGERKYQAKYYDPYSFQYGDCYSNIIMNVDDSYHICSVEVASDNNDHCILYYSYQFQYTKFSTFFPIIEDTIPTLNEKDDVIEVNYEGFESKCKLYSAFAVDAYNVYVYENDKNDEFPYYRQSFFVDGKDIIARKLELRSTYEGPFDYAEKITYEDKIDGGFKTATKERFVGAASDLSKYQFEFDAAGTLKAINCYEDIDGSYKMQRSFVYSFDADGKYIRYEDIHYSGENLESSTIYQYIDFEYSSDRLSSIDVNGMVLTYEYRIDGTISVISGTGIQFSFDEFGVMMTSIINV